MLLGTSDPATRLRLRRRRRRRRRRREGRYDLTTLRGDRARVQTEMVEFIIFPFPFSRKLKIC